jgi:hypothetical protein
MKRIDEAGSSTQRHATRLPMLRLAAEAEVVHVATKARHIPAVIGEGLKPQKIR